MPLPKGQFHDQGGGCTAQFLNLRAGGHSTRIKCFDGQKVRELAMMEGCPYIWRCVYACDFRCSPLHGHYFPSRHHFSAFL